jgi:regulator of sigma E protease
MFDTVLTIFYTFIALGTLVTFHEFGHFWVARRCGVRVEQFSIGFGKALFKRHDKHGTEFIFAMLPLGGYVRMLDQRAGDVAPEDAPFAFNTKTPLQRLAIISAGPMANFLLAGVIFWFIFLGGERGLSPVIGDVEPASIAEQSGFESGMKIVDIAGQQTDSWAEVSRVLFDFIGTSGEIPFLVTYSDSSIRYELRVSVQDWLADEEAPMPLRTIGLYPPFVLDSLLVAAVVDSAPGDQSGLRAGDQLVAVNDTPIVSTSAFIEHVSENSGQPLKLSIQRRDESGSSRGIDIYATPESVIREGKAVGQLGIQLSSSVTYPESLVTEIDYGLISAIPRAIEEVVANCIFVVKSVGKLVTGNLSPKNLSGPITIAKVAGDTARAGFDNFIRFVAILSIMLGVMNLMPVPVLDGGHIVFILIEVMKGSPVSERIQLVGYKAGFAMLISLMIFATFNDLMRPF